MTDGAIKRLETVAAAERDSGLPAQLQAHVGDDEVVTIDRDLPVGRQAATGSLGFIHAPFVLQDVADYRGLLRDWFAMLRIGGRLAIEVPHAHLFERTLALPAAGFPMRKRLYTPASLLSEVEEALEPNNYRIRLLCDEDDRCDLDEETPARDAGSILLLLQRVDLPHWSLGTGEMPSAPPPTFAFEPARTRREVAVLAPRRRIIILKLDHLGDFIMGVPALEKVRATFPDAEITLVVGHWNEQLARDLRLFDTVAAFDAFPRNSTEEKVDLGGRVADFERAFPAEYDLAIDLRTDPDTRFFLRHLRAGLRAGLGTRSQFDFLDIFLPIDGTRHGVEAASTQVIEHGGFLSLSRLHRSPYRIAYEPDRDEEGEQPRGHLVWGPYLRCDPGDYVFIPHVEIGGDDRQLLRFDVAFHMTTVMTVALGTTSAVPQLAFRVEEPDTLVEFRIFAVDGEPVPAFSFYGGRLHRRGASSVLHQSEYLALLVDLVAMRVDRYGLLREEAVRP